MTAAKGIQWAAKGRERSTIAVGMAFEVIEAYCQGLPRPAEALTSLGVQTKLRRKGITTHIAEINGMTLSIIWGFVPVCLCSRFLAMLAAVTQQLHQVPSTANPNLPNPKPPNPQTHARWHEPSSFNPAIRKPSTRNPEPRSQKLVKSRALERQTLNSKLIRLNPKPETLRGNIVAAVASYFVHCCLVSSLSS